MDLAIADTSSFTLLSGLVFIDTKTNTINIYSYKMSTKIIQTMLRSSEYASPRITESMGITNKVL